MSSAEQEDGSFRVTTIPCPFENLVALHVRWPGNRLNRRFPINLRLEVDEHQLEIPVRPSLIRRLGQNLVGQTDATNYKLRLRIRLKFCYVRYREKGITISGESKYESAIAFGKYETHRSEKSQAIQRSQIGAGLGSKAALRTTLPSQSADVHASADFAQSQNRAVEMNISATQDIYEVQAVPNGWLVGNPERGDFLKASGCLSGRYFARPNQEFPHTCEAEFLGEAMSGRLTFIVTVRDGLNIERVNGGNPSREEKIEAEATMRNKIAALRVERSLTLIGGRESRNEGEMPLATAVCEVVRGTDYERVREAPLRLVSCS